MSGCLLPGIWDTQNAGSKCLYSAHSTTGLSTIDLTANDRK